MWGEHLVFDTKRGTSNRDTIYGMGGGGTLKGLGGNDEISDDRAHSGIAKRSTGRCYNDAARMSGCSPPRADDRTAE